MSTSFRINDRLVCLNDENTRVKSLQDVELMWELLKKSPAIKMVNVNLYKQQQTMHYENMKTNLCVCKIKTLFSSRLLKTLISCRFCREFGDGCIMILALRYTKSRLHFTTVKIRDPAKSYLPYI